MRRFLLVSLNIDAILGEITVRQRRQKLEEITRGNGLGDAYTATLTRLKAQKGNKPALGLKVLMWVLYSERPLRAMELCHALGVEIGSTDLDSENLPALRTLLASCLGLVTIEASSSTVRLVHFTLQEHLSSDPTLFHNPHSTIAEVCLTYLNFGYVRGLSPEVYCAPSTIPFLDYASCYWGEHARRGMTENVKVLALRLLDRFDEHISSTQLLLRYTEDSGRERDLDKVDGETKFTGLHGVAFLGVVEVVSAVLKMKEWDINAADCFGCTALIWAAEKGHEAIVKMLLERKDVNPDLADTVAGRTPLSWAAENGHVGVVQMLLEREDVNPNTIDNTSGDTPLSWAALGGQTRVVKMLLERQDINPDQADTRTGRTPLSWAADSGYAEIVKMLLEREGLKPNTTDTQDGLASLPRASGWGHEGIIKMFLEPWSIKSNPVKNKDRYTPLSWAAARGETAVLQMLLELKGANPNTADTQDGRTPLSQAAEHGHEGIVRILLEQENVNPDQADTKSGRTPLSWAAERGHEGVVEMLLGREDVNPNRVENKYGCTPLSWATGRGEAGVVKLLLEREDINPDQADTRTGRTPLSWAAECGHEAVVKMLLERADVNPNSVEKNYGSTPLSWAAERGEAGVVKLLLQREDINPNQADTKTGRTPLSWAIERGHEAVVKLLSERKDPPTAMPDSKDQTPPSLALSKGRDGAMLIIHERGNINSDCQTTLPPVAGSRDQSVVEIQFRVDDPSIIIANLNSHPTLLSVDHDVRSRVADVKDYISKSAGSDFSSTEPSKPSQSSSVCPITSPPSRQKTGTHPNSSRSTMPIVADWYWVIASSICLLAFLFLISPSSSSISPFHK